VLNAYPGALVGSVIAALLTAALAIVWVRRMVQDTTPQEQLEGISGD
jgi:hypothetical protein